MAPCPVLGVGVGLVLAVHTQAVAGAVEEQQLPLVAWYLDPGYPCPWYPLCPTLCPYQRVRVRVLPPRVSGAPCVLYLYTCGALAAAY